MNDEGTYSSENPSRILHPFSALKRGQLPISIVSASGTKLTTSDGREIIDAISSWWVNLHGHTHPYIASRISEQARVLEHVIFSGFTHQPAEELARRLLHKLPGDFSSVFFSDNGSTAVEVAIKMAIQFWRIQGQDRNLIAAFRNAYHGDTFGAMSVSERDVFVEPFESHLFQVDFIPLPTEDNFQEVRMEFRKLMQKKPAAFIFEPLIQGAGGMRMYDAEMLNELMGIAREYEVLLIADEVMTGFYRTGRLFACEHLHISPDFVCLAKALTGGFMPLAVTAFNAKIAGTFSNKSPETTFYHGHSYTANPLACAAALANMDLCERPEAKKNVIRISKKHQEFLQTISGNPRIENERTLGLILALDFKTNRSQYFYLDPIKIDLYEFFLRNDILMRPLGNVIYVLPPLCTTDEELEKIYEVISTGLEHIR
jgi:adenosylmethionine---8-amino-7-oxononanoate aminotransferase